MNDDIFQEKLTRFVDRLLDDALEDPAAKAAVELKRLYDAYVEAGFEDWQAFELLRDSMRVAAGMHAS